MSATYIILALDEFDDEGLPLVWSNDEGWTQAEYGDVFTQDERDNSALPITVDDDGRIVPSGRWHQL